MKALRKRLTASSSQIEKKAETPRLRRSYSAEVMSNAQEFDLQTIDVSIISKALKASRQVEKRLQGKLGACSSVLRDYVTYGAP